MRHFYYYPSIEYSNNTAVNIMVRAKIREAVIQKKALYYQYRIKNGLRPDIISAKYYGSTIYAWAIFYANNIFHPLHDWPMEEQTFNKYLEKKYGMSYPRGGLASTHHYELYNTETKESVVIDETTYKQGRLYNSSGKTINRLPDGQYEVIDTENNITYILSEGDYVNTFSKNVLRKVSIYQYEFDLNEAKRNIVILDSRFIGQITNELNKIF